MLWSPIDVAELFHKEGMTGRKNRVIAVATCWAESHGDDQAKLDNTLLTPPGRGIDRGLMQINSFWHPEVTDEMAFDGPTNIREAVRIYRGRDNTFTAWSAFQNGSYKKYLELAECAVEAALRLRAVNRDLETATTRANDYFTQLAAKDGQIAALQGQLDVLNIRMEAAATELTTLRAGKERFNAWVDSLWGPEL